ncbi:MAG: hypothetical protein HKM28_01395, partial [Flavobacteriaceae bacterium]|nr:hypothetical protein [Flavobacteriaceae bacterium]
MKKVFLLVAVFLIGSTTPTFANHQKNVVEYPGITDRYANLQSIRFVEQGILYTVMSNGNFEFEAVRIPRKYRKRGRNNQHDFNAGPDRRNRGHRKFHPQITWDRFGRVRSVNNTWITYKRNGKVRSIGSVPMHYQRGLLMKVGNMDIVYNRFGDI